MTLNAPVVQLRPARRTTAADPAAPLLRVDGLGVRFGTDAHPVDAVDHASFSVAAGETVCLVGESGSGKTVSAQALLRLDTYRHARITRGSVMFEGRDLVTLPDAVLGTLRGGRIGMVFQEPMTAFDPVFSIGVQIVETLLRHERIGRRAAWERAVALLEKVRMPDARLRMNQIPQELSGGMRQRAMIAMALACNPALLIADEPTTALDVTIQAQILGLLKDLQRETGMGILLITHDLGVAAEMADRVVVMYAGRVVEQAPVHKLFATPAHPYTRALLASVVPAEGRRGVRLPAIAGSIPRAGDMPGGCRFHPRCASASARCAEQVPPTVTIGDREVACWHSDTAPPPVITAAVAPIHIVRPAPASAVPPLVEAVNLSKHFATRGGLFGRSAPVRALDGVDLAIAPGETVGLVGESGCGKSTLGRVLLRLDAPTHGEVRFEGRNLAHLDSPARRDARRNMQMIFQDPYGSIDPRWTVGDVIAEPLVANTRLVRAEREGRVEELLDLVGLHPSARHRHAHEFSGGQRQRIGIARAIALNPKFILADEAVSALDLSVQAQVVNLLGDLRERLGLTCLFIGHGLHVVRHLSDRIGVMYLGRLVEVAPADALFQAPLHPYTRALLASVPVADPLRRRTFSPPAGELPSPTSPPPGCRFHPRCPAATERCRTEVPVLRDAGSGRTVACHFPGT